MVLNKRIIFHIGPPKTGSSAIQHFLHLHRESLAEHGVVYPRHNVDENGISSGNARTICEEDREGRLVLCADKLQHVLANFAAATDKHILLFSSESFFRIADDIPKYVPDAEILCFVRNPIEFQLSIYNQSVKRHGNTDQFKLSSTLNLMQWKRLLAIKQQVGAEKFHGFAYKLPGDSTSIIDDVLSVLALTGKLLPNNQAVNKSYAFAALELKRWLNGFPIDNVQSELDAYLQSVSDDEAGYRLIDDRTLETYKAELQKRQTKFDALLDADEWQRVFDTLGHIEALPERKQQENCEVFCDMVNRLKKEKPLLYLALAAIVTKTASADVPRASKALFTASPALKIVGYVQLAVASVVSKVRQFQIKAPSKHSDL